MSPSITERPGVATPVLYCWECPCGARGPIRYSQREHAEVSASRHAATHDAPTSAPKEL